MAILSATEKLKLLVSGKATLKEINELEKQAEDEKTDPEPKVDPEPDEKDKRIAELEAQLKEAQKENVNGNNETFNTNVSFDEQLNEMFKDIRI